MQLKLYKTQSEKNTLNKVLTDELTITGQLTKSTNILNPEIQVEFNSALLSYNYAKIEVFGNRYYYISNMNIDGKTIYLQLSIDPLMTYKDSIKSSKARITRCQTGSAWLPDNKCAQTNKINWSATKLNGGFTKKDDYLIIVGGKIKNDV